ncbi:MAG TPA: T9SS type A sorting domain-containing protein [Gemmatimonadales bacterium]|nr:T9SS type A sorting domain-containing protein [Gemmatimonadales bacterium]
MPVPRWVGCALVLLAGVAGSAFAQERPPPRVDLHDNYPNPFFPSTTIPFVLSPELCERGHQPLVSLKIYNVLVQVVAVPILLNSNGERLDGLRLRCGAHEAFWDGKLLEGNNRELTQGVYYAQLTVDGERYTLKMIARR